TRSQSESAELASRAQAGVAADAANIRAAPTNAAPAAAPHPCRGLRNFIVSPADAPKPALRLHRRLMRAKRVAFRYFGTSGCRDMDIQACGRVGVGDKFSNHEPAARVFSRRLARLRCAPCRNQRLHWSRVRDAESGATLRNAWPARATRAGLLRAPSRSLKRRPSLSART